MYGNRELTVRPKPPGYVITLAGQRQPLVLVVPDAKYPGMWRVQEPDCPVSDMVNLSRAIDAARHRAMFILNKPTEPVSTAVLD
jgi:hypothetical protein